MIYKEEQILFPICLDRFTADEWAEIWASSPRYGWCLVEPREGYTPADPHAAGDIREPDGVSLPTGNLAVEQLIAHFLHASRWTSRLWMPTTASRSSRKARTESSRAAGPSLAGRCRTAILREASTWWNGSSSDFREGRQNVAEFWIQFPGRFVHIRYFAVRSEDGRYLGTLEVTQDVDQIRALKVSGGCWTTIHRWRKVSDEFSDQS